MQVDQQRVIGLVAAACVTAESAACFAFFAPMNAVFGAWTTDALPADWTRVRYRWELGRAIGAALVGLGFSASVVALLGETPNEPVGA
jgi:hypothetical protein